MAPCCNNIVTPRMIKSGNVSIGDQIQLDEEVYETVSDSAPDASSKKEESSDDLKYGVSNEEYITAGEQSESFSDIEGITGGVINSRVSGHETEQQTENISGTSWYKSPVYRINAAKSEDSQVSPLPYSQMTSYMSNVSMGGTAEKPSIIMPQAPMTPDGYDEEIDYDTVQALNGFLRTQIGRYMRIEQLVGSNTVQDRYGFLVGVGSNYIILQEITTGNIMVLDIFSVRLTYVSYSPPVLPNL